MQRMQEIEFEKIKFTKMSDDCKHEVVKLYDLGSHSDYGCVYCGLKSLDLKVFNDLTQEE